MYDTIEEQLDEILKEALEAKIGMYGLNGNELALKIYPFKDRWSDKKRLIDASMDYYEALWNKLQDDKYIEPQRFPSNNFLTVNGELFINSGGYTQKQINEDASSRYIGDQNRRMERNEVILAGGTVGLVIVEILTHWKDLMDLFCSCFP